MIFTALFVLQDVTGLEKVQGLCGEIYTASSHDVSHAVIIKTEEFSDAEEVEEPVPVTFPGIKAEPEVSCVSVSMLSWFHKYTTAQFTYFCYSEQLKFVGSSFIKAIKCIRNMGQVQRSRHDRPPASPPSQSVCMPFSDYTESAVLLLFTFYP
jgi:hypothetical protein